MKTILLNVDYQDETGKYWQDSYLKNTLVDMQDGETIHETVSRVLQDSDYVEMSYKGKPQSNVYQETKTGETKTVGYIYRVKSEVQTDNGWEKALFTAWVTILSVCDYPIEELY